MTTHTPPKLNCAVSVIIPMYNAKDYIAECLNSLLNQTFKDFEVIVVDDCSTDDSFKIVKSYESKFDGRLTLTNTEKNSGGGGYVPRNVGLNISIGDYIFFADADDFLAENALETFYDSAKGFNADVVYTSAYYELTTPEDSIIVTDGEGKALLKDGLEDKPSLTEDDPAKNLDRLLPEGNFRTPWVRFIRRDFLIDNNISFPEVITGGDFLWTIQVHCNAKKFLRIPTPIYYHRNYNVESVSRTKRTPQEQIAYWFAAFDTWARTFQELVNATEILKNSPDYSYQAMRGHFGYCFSRIAEEKWQLDRRAIYEVLYNEFAKRKNSTDFMSTFLFSSIVFYRKSLSRAKWDLGKLKDGLNQPNREDNSETNILPFRSVTCAVSVIIPLYNDGKYIGECLDSLLAQTFKDFEVIIVDNGSTDKSLNVVDNYAPRFSGRLVLEKLESHSDSYDAPRNKGLELASGEYVFFMNAADVLTKTALEEIYSLAKEFDAEIVYCEKYFTSTGMRKRFMNNIRLAEDATQQIAFVDKPTLETENLAERISKAMDDNYRSETWRRFVKRKLLIDNNILFNSTAGLSEIVWSFEVLLCSKHFLKVPNACYINRLNVETQSLKEDTTPELIRESLIKTIAKHSGGNSDLFATLYDNINEQRKALEDSRNELAATAQRVAELEKELERLKNGESDLPAATTTDNAPAQVSSCAVSVIVPMYNAAEYIAECLDSLLIQTLEDFEVIVVDDCSTDNSVEIAESYIEKFNGRLTLTKTKVNSSGGGYVPRNVGLKLASGEYVFFVDADDFILATALETLYSWAKENESDVVYTGAYYDLRQLNDVYVSRDGESRDLLKAKQPDEPTLTIDEPKEIINTLLTPSRQKNFRNLWTKFIRRDFLITNEIVFPEIMTGGDFLWVINVYCHAKRFLRLPTPLYFYRRYAGGIFAWNKEDSQEQLAQGIQSFVAFVEALNSLKDKNDILRENPSHCYEVLRRYFNTCLDSLSEELDKLSPEELYQILYHVFGEENDEFDSMMPFFFSNILQRKKNTETIQKQFDTLKNSARQPKTKE